MDGTIAVMEGREYDPELLELAWAQLRQEWDTIVKMCQIAVRRGHEHWHEALSEVALRLPDVLLSWDPSGGRTLNSHVIGNCRWFIYKEFVWKRRDRQRRLQEAAPYIAHDGSTTDDHAGRDLLEEARYILEGLDEVDQVVLRLYFEEGLTLVKLGEVIGCSKSMADRLLTAALHRAKIRASRMR